MAEYIAAYPLVVYLLLGAVTACFFWFYGKHRNRAYEILLRLVRDACYELNNEKCPMSLSDLVDFAQDELQGVSRLLITRTVLEEMAELAQKEIEEEKRIARTWLEKE